MTIITSKMALINKEFSLILNLSKINSLIFSQNKTNKIPAMAGTINLIIYFKISNFYLQHKLKLLLN